jgi:hypothetical protein
MLEFTTSCNKKIYVFEEIIPKHVCEQIKSKFPPGIKQKIWRDEEWAEEISQIVKKYVSNLPIVYEKVAPYVTISASEKPINKHIDFKVPNTAWKIFIYLNEVENGETIFFDGDKEIPIPNKQGSLVLFDLLLPHKGNPLQSSVKKYIAGIRPFIV